MNQSIVRPLNVPPGITGYETRTTDYAEKSQLDREDEAKKVLAELGYGPDKPLKMEIRFNTSENHKNTAVAIQEQLKPLGIEVSLVNTDTKTHYGLLEQHGAAFGAALDLELQEEWLVLRELVFVLPLDSLQLKVCMQLRIKKCSS